MGKPVGPSSGSIINEKKFVFFHIAHSYPKDGRQQMHLDNPEYAIFKVHK